MVRIRTTCRIVKNTRERSNRGQLTGQKLEEFLVPWIDLERELRSGVSGMARRSNVHDALGFIYPIFCLTKA
jgi:hypothetical protein